MAPLPIKRNDTRTAIKGVLKTPMGNIVDLTGASVRFIMVMSGKKVIDRDATILDETNGIIAFVFAAGETATAGFAQAEFKITYPDGNIETFPNSGYIPIEIEADLA